MIPRNYAARHSIPPGGAIPPSIRIGANLRVSLADTNQSARSFHPTVAAPSPLAGAKRGVSAEMRRLDQALESLAAELRESQVDTGKLDEYLSREVELVLAHLQRLAEAL